MLNTERKTEFSRGCSQKKQRITTQTTTAKGSHSWTPRPRNLRADPAAIMLWVSPDREFFSDAEPEKLVQYFKSELGFSPAFPCTGQGMAIRGCCVAHFRGRIVGSYVVDTKHRRGGRGVEKGTGYVRQRPAKWQRMVPLRIRAMVLAGDHLFAAGMPDVVDPEDPLAAFEGRKGALLQVFSAKDGSLLKSYSLSSPPAFDGLSAAGDRLYLATPDNKVICFAGVARK